MRSGVMVLGRPLISSNQGMVRVEGPPVPAGGAVGGAAVGGRVFLRWGGSCPRIASLPSLLSSKEGPRGWRVCCQEFLHGFSSYGATYSDGLNELAFLRGVRTGLGGGLGACRVAPSTCFLLLEPGVAAALRGASTAREGGQRGWDGDITWGWSRSITVGGGGRRTRSTLGKL